MAKIKLPVLHKDKNINTAIYVVILAVVLYAAWKGYNYYKNRGTEEVPATATGGSTTTGTATAPVYTDSTVFSKKSPMMKDKRVQWMQDAYNKYAKLRKQYGKTPNWPTIDDDGAFGNDTQAAMNRIMGKTSASWNEVRTRSTYLTNQLIQGGLGTTPTNPSNDPYGYNFGV